MDRKVLNTTCVSDISEQYRKRTLTFLKHKHRMIDETNQNALMMFRQHIEQLPEKTHVLQLLYPSTIPRSISTRAVHHPHPIYRGIDDTQSSGIDDSSPTQRNPQPKPPNPMQFKPANNHARQSTCLQHQIPQIRRKSNLHINTRLQP